MNAKKTAFGITGVAAAALLTLGAVAPAMADDNTSSNDTTHSTTDVLGDINLGGLTSGADLGGILGGSFTGGSFTGGDLNTTSPVVVAPQIGDVASGNAVGSGNDVTAPLLSGNETSAGNGNSVGNPSVGNGSSVGANVSDLVDSSVGDISGSVSDIVGDATSSVDLGAILGR